MSFVQSAVDEVRRSPVTVLSTVAGLVIAALALFVAYLPYLGHPAAAPTTGIPTIIRPERIDFSNLALCIAFFFAASFTSASIVRMLARVHSFAAFVFSVPFAALTCFLSLVVLHLAPPKAINDLLTGGIVDTVFYGTVFIYVAITGKPVIQDFASDVLKPNDPALAGVLTKEEAAAAEKRKTQNFSASS